MVFESSDENCNTHQHDCVNDITQWAQEYFQKPLSVNTIHRTICRGQLKTHLNLTVSKWESVLRSDKSKFDIPVDNHGRRVLQAKEEGDLPACYQHSVQKPASLMVWRCMCGYGMGTLHVLEGTMNSEI